MPDIDIPGADPGALIVSLVPVALWVLALVCAGIAILRGPRPVTRAFVIDRVLRYLFLFPLGLQGVWAFFCQVFLPEETANAIGWEPSPFQFEVGVANLGLGLASFYAAFSVFGARAAVAILAGCFLAGAGFGHLIDIAQGDNLSAGNAGPILYTDFLTPIVVLVLLLLFPRTSGHVVARSAKTETTPSKPPQAAKLQPAKALQQAETEPLAKTAPQAAQAPKIEPTPVKIETAPAKVAEKPPQAEAQPSIEDQLETARKSMRESLGAGPRPEFLTSPKTEASDRPRKGPRRGKTGPETQG